MYSGDKPFPDVNEHMAMAKIIAGSRPIRPPSVTDPLWALMKECWSEDAKGRPGIADVYNRLVVMGLFD